MNIQQLKEVFVVFRISGFPSMINTSRLFRRFFVSLIIGASSVLRYVIVYPGLISAL